MNAPTCMTDQVYEYIAYRRSLGFKFSEDKDGGELIGFGRYLDRIKFSGPLTIDVAVQWAKDTSHHAPIHWARRLDLARGFAQYRAQFDLETEVPPPGILGSSRYPRNAPYIYSDKEIEMLIGAASAIHPIDGLRPKTFTVLFGILACTGIRVSEALGLNNADVDLSNGLLTIRWSKFNRSRLVPLHPSTVTALYGYRTFRDNYLKDGETAAFFVNENGSRLYYHNVNRNFRCIRAKLDWTEAGRTRRPRVHDLRHTFAVKTILRWYRENENIDQKIAVLASYLGHVNITKTYWYLTGVPELLSMVGSRFEKFSSVESGRQL